ncbi:MAG: Uma2 family endonuclease [Planctomycetia bacterium]|nr:Uma2 family endonuclease [Planctomycetia bacterium]
MATDHPAAYVPLTPVTDYAPRLMTAADLAELPAELPSGPVHYELDDGVLISMSPPGFLHGSVESGIVAALRQQGEDRGHGLASCGEVGIVLRRNPDRVVGADAAFISSAQLPVQLTPEGYLETIPALVVEVVSKNDTRKYLARKVNDYLRAGVQCVWVVDPQSKSLTEHRANTEARTFDASATVTLADLIPDFELALAGLFR